MTDLATVLREVDLRFASGNAIPVERATIKVSEWAVIREALARAVGDARELRGLGR